MLNGKEIDVSKIKLGKESYFKDDKNKKIIPIYYNDKDLTFTLPNKFFEISKIREDAFDRKYIIIKSNEINEILNKIIESLDVDYNINKFVEYTNLFFNKNTDFDFEKIKDNAFSACLSITVSSLFVNENNANLNLKINDMIVIEVKEKLEIDHSKLEAAT